MPHLMSRYFHNPFRLPLQRYPLHLSRSINNTVRFDQSTTYPISLYYLSSLICQPYRLLHSCISLLSTPLQSISFLSYVYLDFMFCYLRQPLLTYLQSRTLFELSTRIYLIFPSCLIEHPFRTHCSLLHSLSSLVDCASKAEAVCESEG